MNELHPFLKKRPDGRYEETRFRYKRGMNVRILGGQYPCQMAVVECLLDDGRCITIRWDLVEELG